ncbi:MAG: diguanylate cyclase, partial [Jannaschia sp.]
MALPATTLLLMLLSAVAGGLLSIWFLRRRVGIRVPMSLAHGSEPSGTRRREDSKSAGGALALLDVDDLDGLNVANDYDTGDRLLDQIESVLGRARPEEAGLERLDSGRFLIWLPETDLDAAAGVVERLRRTASQTFVEGVQGKAARNVSAGLVGAVAEGGRPRA